MNDYADVGKNITEISQLLNVQIEGNDNQQQDNIIGSIRFETGYKSSKSRNRILFGAPGTGKSHTLKGDLNDILSGGGDYERVTFHPDYSYANFVGTYKPVPSKDDEGREIITYAYVPGPFMRVYVKALLNSKTDTVKPFILVIEEINRANVAAVFGDIFQLLDRDDKNVSEFPIQASEDIKKYLVESLECTESEIDKIKIPDNMFIWATMNSADQGVYPLDTAFKRRWDFTYLGINNSDDKISGKKVILGRGSYRRVVEWNELRKAINAELLVNHHVNEDKLLGTFFIAKKYIPDGDYFDQTTFIEIFKNKVLMYLFDDAAKQRPQLLFANCKINNLYSAICEEFEEKGVSIFCDSIKDRFTEIPEESGE